MGLDVARWLAAVTNVYCGQAQSGDFGVNGSREGDQVFGDETLPHIDTNLNPHRAQTPLGKKKIICVLKYKYKYFQLSYKIDVNLRYYLRFLI